MFNKTLPDGYRGQRLNWLSHLAIKKQTTKTYESSYY